MNDVMRFTVVDAAGRVSFVAPCAALDALVAACARGPRTLLALLGVTHLGGNAGAYHVLARVSDQVAQQVVVVGHRVTQTVEIIGRRLKKE